MRGGYQPDGQKVLFPLAGFDAVQPSCTASYGLQGGETPDVAKPVDALTQSGRGLDALGFVDGINSCLAAINQTFDYGVVLGNGLGHKYGGVHHTV